MKKFIVIPDSFKGTLSSLQVCNIMKKSILEHYPDANVIAIPMADGGEGTVDCFLYATNSIKVSVETTGPFGDCITTYYARMNNTAVIEMASAAGLHLAQDRLNPCKATTYGVGLLIKHAIENGCNEIILGLGGSCTNDGGTGLAQALGTIFYNQKGKPFTPTADTLNKIKKIDNSVTKNLLKGCHVTAMCDIDNPMFGEQGAAYVFAPQKGASPKDVVLLDNNLRSLAKIIKSSLSKDISFLPGAGAAGGLGAGVVAFLDGSLKSGIDTLLNIIEFDKLLTDTDLVFTGEGCIDTQSLHGKVVVGIGKRCQKQNIPVIVVAGSVGDSIEEVYQLGISAVFSSTPLPVDFEFCRQYSSKNLKNTMDNIMRLLKVASR